MRKKNDKQYLIIGEIGIQKAVSSGKDLNRKYDSSLKDLGLTKNDIILISSNKLVDISNLIHNSSNRIYTNNKKINNLDLKDNNNEIFNNNNKENFYLFSKNNRYEIFKQQFDKFYKSKIEDNSLIPSKFIFGGGIGYGGGGKDDIFLSGNKINSNNSQNLNLISYIKDLYTNFKSVSANINSNIYFSNSLINENIENIYRSIIILNKYYKNQIQNIRINHETLLTFLEEVNSRVLSIETKINNYYIIKMNLNNQKEIELFDLLINENKIKQIREKINNQLNYLKEKIKNKSQKFEEIISNYLDKIKNVDNKLNNIIDEKKLNEIKNKIKLIELNFNELNKKYNKYKFEEEIKKIQENSNSNINVNDSNFTFSSLSNRNSFNGKKLYNNISEKNDFNNLSNESNKLKSDSDEILLEIKNFIEDSIIKKFFRFSSEIFITLDSFESFNKKFKTYITLLESIDKDNIDLMFSLDESLKFRFYCNEYERRINFLKDLKRTIIKLKKYIKKENEIRQKFNEELVQYLKDKLNDNQFVIQNNIIAFFEWDDIKGNFDVYGDKYYNNIEIEEEDINREMKIKNNMTEMKISLMLSEEEINNKRGMELDYYSQQDLIYILNKKIMEYKSQISNLEKNIENKNNEFKELKFNFEQINNFLNSLYNNNKTDKSSKFISNKNDDDIKKENKIFNPLYDEINDEDSLVIDNDSNTSKNSLKTIIIKK